VDGWRGIRPQEEVSSHPIHKEKKKVKIYMELCMYDCKRTQRKCGGDLKG
jgi:hypothetical protein